MKALQPGQQALRRARPRPLAGGVLIGFGPDLEQPQFRFHNAHVNEGQGGALWWLVVKLCKPHTDCYMGAHMISPTKNLAIF
jgi:hypothetical protein